MQDSFYKGLEELELLTNEPDDSKRLYFVNEKDKCSNPYIYLALEKAEKYDVDAVYFRIFESQSPIPQIYIYDNTTVPINEQTISERQRRIWNASIVPLIYVFTNTEVLLFNSYNQPEFENGRVQYNIFDKIEFAAEIDKQLKLKKYSARGFDNGSFWEREENQKEFKISKCAYEKLITELRNIRKKLLEASIVIKGNKLAKDEQKKIIHKLLVMSIFLKYLEDKEDDKGNTVFQNNFFAKYSPGANNFIDVLDNSGDLIQLFRDLSIHFNGEIFKLSEVEEENLAKINLPIFAEFFEGKTEPNGQRTLFQLYSFRDLPVELISNIYEEFIEDKKDGIVYTPPFLVNFLLDEAIPLTINDTNTDIKILDPACGSGIFLVQAYKRLIQRWRIKNQWNPPKRTDLKKLLLDNIYGVDKEGDAIRLTAFSLTLALCDELSPLVIWNELKFDKLRGRNLHDSDFFELVEEKRLPADFNLVIGNPPFINKLTDPAYRIESQRIVNGNPKLPDSQLSLLFLDQAIKLCRNGGNLCLILPSGPFLYNIGSFDFRTYILNKYNLKYIVDFTHLSRFLFGSGKGDHPALAVYIIKQSPSKKDILHVTVRKTKSVKEKIWIELDKYDYHNVPYELAISNKKEDKLIWKSNFLGGGRIHSLLKKLAQQRTLKDFINSNKDWVYNEGFILGKKGDLKTAKYLTGSNFIPTKSFTEKGINENEIVVLKEKYFINPKPQELYEPPLLLIKEVIGKKSILITRRKNKITFKHNIVGIHSPKKDSDKLLQIERRIKDKNIFLFYLAGYSSQYLISKSTAILKDDIDNLPYPENEKDITISDIENILIEDVLNYFLEYRHIHTNVAMVEKEPSGEQLELFAQYYLRILNSVYNTYKASRPIETENHIIYPFYWGTRPDTIDNIPNLEIHLNQLLQNTNYPQANLRFIRVMRIYDDNVIYLIKPKQLRYWLRSVAIRDADETFAYLVKQEYSL